MIKIAKLDTLFMTKTAQKPYPFAVAHTYIVHLREYLLGGQIRAVFQN